MHTGPASSTALILPQRIVNCNQAELAAQAAEKLHGGGVFCATAPHLSSKYKGTDSTQYLRCQPPSSYSFCLERLTQMRRLVSTSVSFFCSWARHELSTLDSGVLPYSMRPRRAVTWAFHSLNAGQRLWSHSLRSLSF